MSSGLFSDVVEWFLSRMGDRRQYSRRAGAFHVWAKADVKGQNDGIGTEVSPNGLVFIVPHALTEQQFNVTVALRNHRFPIRLKVVRADQVEYKGKPWHRYTCEFTGIAADNWDLVVRYVNDTPEPADRRKMQNQEMHDKVDDAYRLLPTSVQNKIIDILVKQQRLERPKPGQTPLIKLFYGGLHKVPGKAPQHRLNVHSRVVVDGEAMAYDSRFLVSENGDVEQQ